MSDAMSVPASLTPVSLSTFPDVQLLNLGTFNVPANAYLYACGDMASVAGTRPGLARPGSGS